MRWIFFFAAILPVAALADFRYRAANPTSVIEESMCIPAIDGEGFLHVDEDVSNLVIRVTGDDGTTVALYDAGTEIEDIAVLGTYAAPSENNVRVSPQDNECTQMMFADSVYENQEWIVITVSDGQSTIMDFERWVYMGLATQEDAQSDAQAGAQAAIIENGLDHIFKEAVGGSDVADDSFAAKLVSSSATADFDDYDNTTDSLQAQRDNVGTADGASIAADIAAVPAAVGALEVEDAGDGYDLSCAIATLLAYAAGEMDTEDGTTTYQDPGGNESRLVGTVSGSSRGSITITCP